MLFIKALVTLLYVFFGFSLISFILNKLREFYAKKFMNKNELLFIAAAGDELANKFDVNTCVTTYDVPDDSWDRYSLKDKKELMNFFTMLDEYKAPYIYVADKDGVSLLHVAMNYPIKKAGIKLIE
ncbi:ANK-REP-REGION domain-containing protein [Acinetobacter baumannii]